MKHRAAFVIMTFFALATKGQEKPQFNIKWAPTGLVVGNLSLQSEYNWGGRNSVTAKIGIPLSVHHTLTYQDKDADFNMKATSFLAGYRSYFSPKQMQGLYLEPYVKYVNHTSEGNGFGTLNNRPVVMNFTNRYKGIGTGLQLGAQFRAGKKMVIDLFFLGPEINSATNNFKATETSHTIEWNRIEAEEAEQNIRNFLDQFPFIRNRVKVRVDNTNRSVTADYKGFLPGIRTGFSIGLQL